MSGPRVAVDPAGHGTLLWQEDGGVLRSQVFDGVAPSIEDFDPTTFARRGEVATYSARANDLWSAPSLTWQFDNRAPVAGRHVTRTFRASGVHRVRLRWPRTRRWNRTNRRTVTIVASHRPRLRKLSLSKPVIHLTGPQAGRQTRLSFRLGAPALVRIHLVDRSGTRVVTVTRALEAGRQNVILASPRLDAGRGNFTVRVVARNALGGAAAGHLPLPDPPLSPVAAG